MKKSLLTLLFLPALAIMLFTSGCGKSGKTTKVDKIRILQGKEQCALPGEDFSKKLRLELLGKQEKGLLGGKGNRSPVANSKVLFVNVDGSDLELPKTSALSDAGGSVSIKIKAGKKVGDQYLRVIPKSNPEKSIIIRYVTGVKIVGSNQEGRCGELLHNPMQVKVVSPNGKPAAGVPVYFKLVSAPNGKKTKAKVKKSLVMTDNEGVAETNLKLGKKTGEYNIDVEISDPKSNYHVRGIFVRQLGMNFLSVIISVLGGLALFIFGMKLMSDGLQKVAGDKMKKILHFFASNRFIAVLAGTVVTAVIQLLKCDYSNGHWLC
ncbi:MAG: hypothetical protein GY750_07725 [Lentisphaerae bacterium]|nr:hypothetical protein [Lentisphaerota bacterium]MCP4101295.1 hypothetical protein [Lentisphaerota bacterium]